LAYNRGDGSSVARLANSFTPQDIASAERMRNRLGPLVAWANEVCGNPLSEGEVDKFVSDLQREFADIMTARKEPREIRNTAANRNRINTDATNAAVADFNRKIAEAKTPEEILDLFAPVLQFRARLEKVRREIMRRET
jgi:hypothetical protein